VPLQHCLPEHNSPGRIDRVRRRMAGVYEVMLEYTSWLSCGLSG
jgi:hypothetical protein